ncbi:cbb3-type cytochrome c oxidase N-terminal domain-containing protein [Solitalea koreensis]|uniref:Cytochrome c oxidase cbb3-type subunit 3 n=1 Tax=Solitalea koreensis TaxID=543615 RepID=A0A521BEX3_9SPHI|nr:cbb3-type cytochrome c oxidase N-terminal domain-containing protein [Solitalea koreensis]SMO45623.1 cytochrome c oxidase cbb3-type subunit 3 [Solitalea koreensis]
MFTSNKAYPVIREKLKFIILFCFSMLFGASSIAQVASNANESSSTDMMQVYTYILMGFLMVEFLIIIVMVLMIQRLIKIAFKPELKTIAEQATAVELTIKNKFKLFSFERINQTVPIESENDLLMDHDYDGIKELDNKMPPWFLWLFRVTIVFAVVYLGYYHVMGSGKLQIAEYKEEVAKAQKQIEEYRKKAANLVDETNVTQITDVNQLKEAQVIFKSTCAACHGQLGEGSVGPNLTDDYWLHGGSLKDIFKTIKYGVPEKGMKSWQQDFSPSQIQLLASYIKTLHNSNPPNAKEKQGDLYTEKKETPGVDSTKTTVQDSTNKAMK